MDPPEPPHLELETPGGPVPLGFAGEGRTLFLVARERSARWPIEILRRGRATLRLSDGVVTGAADLVAREPEKSRVLSLFRAKYGDARYARWYDRPARVIQVTLDLGGMPATGVDEGSSAYYRWIEREFDNVADDYDRHISGNRVNRLLRDRSLALLKSTFPPGGHLFEVGCGSGMETLPLLRAGHSLVCVDISQAMLEVVREKAKHEGLLERLRTVRLRARDLPDRARELGPASFDGGYSTYGALNCEPDLGPVARGFAELLRPGARAVVGVYNRWCLFELAGYTLSLQSSRAWGRTARPVPVGASRFCVDTYAYSPGEVERAFGRGFRVERLEGVPFLLPPSDLAPYAEKFSRHFETLARWDARWGARWPFSWLGDHFLMTLRQVPAASVRSLAMSRSRPRGGGEAELGQGEP